MGVVPNSWEELLLAIIGDLFLIVLWIFVTVSVSSFRGNLVFSTVNCGLHIINFRGKILKVKQENLLLEGFVLFQLVSYCTTMCEIS